MRMVRGDPEGTDLVAVLPFVRAPVRLSQHLPSGWFTQAPSGLPPGPGRITKGHPVKGKARLRYTAMVGVCVIGGLCAGQLVQLDRVVLAVTLCVALLALIVVEVLSL